MNRFSRLIDRFCRDQRGATAIEYGLVGGLVSICIITWATLIGERLSGFFSTVATAIVGPG